VPSARNANRTPSRSARDNTPTASLAPDTLANLLTLIFHTAPEFGLQIL
jgi:hypothetical protein